MIPLSLQDKLKYIPTATGIYKLYSKTGALLYVGKAKNLKHRVRSYFNSHQPREITNLLVEKVHDIEFIVTPDEKSALILENQQIKKNKPYFNINLKDSKTYPYLLLTAGEEFPSLLKTRDVYLGKSADKKNIYFGPFTDVGLLHDYLNLIHDLYPLKKCNQKKFPKNYSPCIYYHIGKCLDYCTYSVPKEAINNLIAEVKMLLNGQHIQLTTELVNEMKKEIDRLNFEKANLIKNKIEAIKKIDLKRERAFLEEDNFDVFHYSLTEEWLVIVVLHFRANKLASKSTHEFKRHLFSDWEGKDIVYVKNMMSYFVIEFYEELSQTPMSPLQEILFPFGDTIFASSFIESIHHRIIDIFAKKFPKYYQKPEREASIEKSRLKILCPVRGRRLRFLEIANLNAKLSFQELIKDRRLKQFPKHLKEMFKLPKLPQVVEAFDIANLGDSAIVAGMVRFTRGKPDKEHYRVFNIQSQTRQDDFAAMRQAVYRRYDRLLSESRKLPDLIVVDGGKGQLSAAMGALQSLGIKGQPIVSLAKREEEIFVPRLSKPLVFDKQHPGLLFLIKMRDEVHRFANKSHKRRRDKEEMQSVIQQVEGFGPKKTALLLEQLHRLGIEKLTDIHKCRKQDILSLPFMGEGDYEKFLSVLKKN